MSNLKIGSKQFFTYYMLHPFSKKLSAGDQIKALVSSLAIAVFTGGIVHVVCYIKYGNRQIKPHPEKTSASAKTNRLVHERIISKKNPIIPNAKPVIIDTKPVKLEATIPKNEATVAASATNAPTKAQEPAASFSKEHLKILPHVLDLKHKWDNYNYSQRDLFERVNRIISGAYSGAAILKADEAGKAGQPDVRTQYVDLYKELRNAFSTKMTKNLNQLAADKTKVTARLELIKNTFLSCNHEQAPTKKNQLFQKLQELYSKVDECNVPELRVERYDLLHSDLSPALGMFFTQDDLDQLLSTEQKTNLDKQVQLVVEMIFLKHQLENDENNDLVAKNKPLKNEKESLKKSLKTLDDLLAEVNVIKNDSHEKLQQIETELTAYKQKHEKFRKDHKLNIS